jgi:hypothetical protein
MTHLAQTPCEWFHEADRSYVEKHQGCPWCGGANRVYRSDRNQLLEYHCGGCDFFACHDRESGQYFMGPGHDSMGSLTMVAK